MLYIDPFFAEMYSMHLARSLMTETGSGHPGLTCFIKEYSGPAAAPISFMGHAHLSESCVSGIRRASPI